MQHRSIHPEMTFQPLSFSETKSDSVLSQVLDDENNETIEGTLLDRKDCTNALLWSKTTFTTGGVGWTGVDLPS